MRVSLEYLDEGMEHAVMATIRRVKGTVVRAKGKKLQRGARWDMVL